MSRITGCFAALKAADKKALIPYLVAGDKSLDETLSLMIAMAEEGADIIELGVPFSDPMAEGPVIQKAHERALVNNVSLDDTLDLVAKFREVNQSVPVILMGYSNPVETMGYETFAKVASAKGVDGLLLVDMPPEEAGPLKSALADCNVDMIYLIAPTTNEARIKAICEKASGYLYYVSLKGVTGAGHFDIESVKNNLSVIGQHTHLPISVGFGIKDADSASKVARVADGVVVGSAVVNLIDQDNSTAAVKEAVQGFVRSLREAVDKR